MFNCSGANWRWYNVETIQGLVNIKSPFYASDSDVKMSGAFLSVMESDGFIKKTGNTKSVWIDIDEDIKKRVYVFEWAKTDKFGDFLKIAEYVQAIDNIISGK